MEAQAAEQYKRKMILEGQGEAEKKQLVMNADGALDQKLAAYVAIQKPTPTPSKTTKATGCRSS